MNNWDNIPKDVLMLIALEYDLPDILSFCLSSKRFNDTVCKNNIFWMNKFKRDQPDVYEKIKDKKVNWKQIYIRFISVKNKKYTRYRLFRNSVFDRLHFNSHKWLNPSGLNFNKMQGFSLRKDVNDPMISYLYPSSYMTIFGGFQKPKEGENHPVNMLKISLRDNKIEFIPWDNSVLGERVFYRKGDGKVSWYDDLYEFEIEYDGLKGIFTTYLVVV